MKTYQLAQVGLLNRNPKNLVRGVLTGEFRPPREGEYYLSGAIPEVYRAPNDLSCAYHILKLVRVKTIITEVIEEL